jgi:hypothetical protein
MTDAIFFDAQEKLEVQLGRDPSYEEILDFLNSIFKEKSYANPDKNKHATWSTRAKGF